MADKKISQLTALAASGVVPTTDVMAVVDANVNETKKITVKDVVDGALNTQSANGLVYLNGSKETAAGSVITYNGTTFNVDSAAVFNDSGADVDFRVESDTDANAFFVDGTNGNVGVGTNSPGAKLHLNATNAEIRVSEANTYYGSIKVDSGGGLTIAADPTSAVSGSSIYFTNDGVESVRINADREALFGKITASFSTVGIRLNGPAGRIESVADGSYIFAINRLTSDGDLIEFYQDTAKEGSISVSGSTVSYNGGHLARWSQFPDKSQPTLFKGTVMTNLDQMAAWINLKTGEPEENEQLNCMKVSDVEGDLNVAGVFVNWDKDGDLNIAMTGDMIIRIAKNVTVQRGDLLMSAGDGTAKPQGDDIVRSKTIAKVTSNHVIYTYEDGSYCVPCVLMAC